MITIDLDGTLLNRNGIVTQKTKDVLKKLIKQNIDIVIASGRPISSIKTIAREIGCQNYFIAGNGSIIYDLRKNEIIFNQSIKKEIVLKIIKICEENSIYYNLYTTKEIIAKSLKYNVLYYQKENQSKVESDKTQINIVQDVYKYVEDIEDSIIKITICDEYKSIFNSIMKKIKQIKQIDILDVEHTSRKVIKEGTTDVEINYYYTEITIGGINKWSAIEKIKNIENISNDEIIAIGDNMNDKEMIENSGLGIVMKGSTPRIIEFADIVTENDNDNDGVSTELEKIFDIS